jgi:hypothetical protein
VQLTLTPIFGDADLYANIGIDEPATRSSPFRSLSATGTDQIIISSTDPRVRNTSCDPALGQTLCTVRIGVFGFSEETAFYVLVATTSNLVQLLDGVAQYGTVSRNNYTYFFFDMRQDRTVRESCACACAYLTHR